MPTELIDVFPHELRRGDVYRDDAGTRWMVVAPPHTYLGGKHVSVKLAPIGTPAVETSRDWLAYEKITVRRASQEPS